MYLVIGIILLCLAGLIGSGSNQPEWKKEGYRTYDEYDKARKGGRRLVTYDEQHYYWTKAYNEWRDRKWTTEDEEKFLEQTTYPKNRWIRDIADKMAYDDGLAPWDDMTKYKPSNIHNGFWKAYKFAFDKWKEEGIIIYC